MTQTTRAVQETITAGEPAAPAGRAAPAVPGLSPAPAREHLSGTELLLTVLIAAFTFALYIPSLSNRFVDFDDHHYVTANPIVQRGLTREGLVWAFTTTKFANWLPMTWLSHMLDCHFYGLNAGGHHGTSAALHAFNAAALFLALRGMTARVWASAAVAALFAVHPLRVESVSWVSERKDVLCGTFFMLSLLAYAAYCRRPSVMPYLGVVVCHALGLMSKTMLVTLPCLLLLLDYWPLRRLSLPWGPAADDAPDGVAPPYFPPRPLKWLVLEKLPLLALSVVSSGWTLVFQSTGGAMWGTRDLSTADKLGNAVVSVPRYLGKIALPKNLSAFYPHPGSWPVWAVAGAAVLVLVLTLGAAAVARRRPYITVGWFWFLGMLVPVLGIIQVGLQSMADRYTYLPAIGLAVAVVWSVAAVVRRLPVLKPIVAGVTLAVLALLSVATWREQGHWKDTYHLFKHALDSDDNNWLGHNMVGSVFAANGERAWQNGDPEGTRVYYENAAYHLKRSMELNSRHYLTGHNYAWSLYRIGRKEEAVAAFHSAIEAYSGFGWSHLYLGLALSDLGRHGEAETAFAEAARLMPREAEVYAVWGEALLKRGDRAGAAEKFREALRHRPDHRAARQGLDRLSMPAAPVGPALGPRAEPPPTPPGQ